MEPPEPQQWPLLERLAEGSVRRALQLAGSGGLELYGRIEAIFAGLPNVDWPAAHTLSDQLGADRAGAALRGLLQPVPRPAGPAGAGPRHGPQRGPGARPGAAADPGGAPAAWAELWQTVLRERDEAVLLNLDRKALILGILARLEALARR